MQYIVWDSFSAVSSFQSSQETHIALSLNPGQCFVSAVYIYISFIFTYTYIEFRIQESYIINNNIFITQI